MMKKFFHGFLAVFFILGIFYFFSGHYISEAKLQGQERTITYDYVNVREEPKVPWIFSDNVITTITKGEKVILTGEKYFQPHDTPFEEYDYWYQIQYNSYKGWVVASAISQ